MNCPSIWISTMKTRRELIAWLAGREVAGAGVEVGVHRGEFAAEILELWPGEYIGVDHYQPDYDPEDPAAKGDREADKAAAKAIIEKRPNARLLVCSSASAAVMLRTAKKPVAWVYIDACHRFQDVLEDLFWWHSVVVPGGIVAGHDIVNGSMWTSDVMRAVVDFCMHVHIPTLHIIPDTPGSFFFEKSRELPCVA